MERIVAPLGNLPLHDCVESLLSGLRSEDSKKSKMREELELIDFACPYLEHLGVVEFFDSRISYAIEMVTVRTSTLTV
jgi:hypothetical protein